MAIFQHREISARQRRSPFYYEKWYRCLSDSCRTTVVLPDQFRVWNIEGEDRSSLESWLAKQTTKRQVAQ
jgi:hypothetical protein